MTRAIDQKQSVPSLRRVIRHPSAAVRLEALKSSYPCYDPELVAAATALIADKDQVAGQAMMTEAIITCFAMRTETGCRCWRLHSPCRWCG